MAINASVLLRLTELQRHFLDGLPARWTAIALTARGSDAQRATLHRLAGAAGSFGYAALGEAARSAEGCSDADMDVALSKLQQVLLKTLSDN
jgi:HPt (histidine-containing phosphotransfer) domain-containing protein